MTLVPNTSFILLLATAVTSGLSALTLWRRRQIPGGDALALMTFGVCAWTLVASFEAGASSLAAKILFSKLEYVGSGSVSILLLVFALRHAGLSDWLTRRRLALVGMIPVINLALVFSNDWHGLLWTGFSPGPPGSNQIVYHHGPIFFAIVAALYALVLPATIVLARTAIRESKTHRRQAVAILVAGAAPWVGTVLYMANIEPLAGFNLIPMSFAVTGIALSLSVVGLGHFDLVPVARSALVENMSDAVLALDAQGVIIDVNEAAERLLAAAPGRLVGRTDGDALSAWPSILELARSEEPTRGEALLDEEPLRYVDVRVTPLRFHRGHPSARLVVLRDITPRYRAEREARHANERLREQLDEIEHLHEELREQAIRDPLTSLFNRRYLQETLPREIARAARDGTQLALLLLDVDGFKSINDTAGHPAGDAILKSLGGLLAALTRKGDMACRYGGDEFALVLPNTSLQSAALRADEIRARFAEEADRLGGASISVGVAAFPRNGPTEEDVLKAADRALYVAKASGRDRVRTA